MDLRTLARLAGLVGGLCWLARLVMDSGGDGSGVILFALHWGGGLLLAVALVGAGAGVVGTHLVWLRAIVAIAFPLLVWSILEVLHENGNATVIDGVFGLVVAVASGLQLARSRPATGQRRQKPPKPPRPRAGAHAR